MKSKLSKIIVLCLIITLTASLFTTPAFARASPTISRYDAYIYPTGNGNIQIWFDITGTKQMDELGASTIYLYEKNNGSWSLVTIYYSAYDSSMLRTDSVIHSSYVSYSGTAGKEYRATVYYWAERDGVSDSKSKTTLPEFAT